MLLPIFFQTLKKQNENIMFEKDELNLSFKSLQEDYNATVQENKVVY